MAEDWVTLEHELRQIIQTDRMAIDILQRAKDVRSTIDEKTEKEKASIAQEAKNKKDVFIRELEEKLKQDLAQRKAKAAQMYATQKQTIDKNILQNEETWVEEITSSILNVTPLTNKNR